MTQTVMRFTAAWLLLLIVVACDGGPIQIEVEPEVTQTAPDPYFEIRTESGKTVLQWAEPLQYPGVGFAVLDSRGGTVPIPGTGVSLVVPRYSFWGYRPFILVAYSGEDVAFNLQPHGLRFSKPVEIRIELDRLEQGAHYRQLFEEASGSHVTSGVEVQVGTLEAVYYAGHSSVIKAIESLPVYVRDGTYLVFKTTHFSGYALAS